MEIFKINSSHYGSPRIKAELCKQEETCSKNRVARRSLRALAKAKKTFKITTDSSHHLPVVANLLNRDFIAKLPEQKWVGT
jgi:hypothetical protein